MDRRRIKIENGRVISGGNIVHGKSVYLENGRIYALTEQDLPCDERVDAKECYVSAGFIDMHVHGGGGCDVMDGGAESILKVADLHRLYGTTTILPTSLSCSTETLLLFLKDLREAMDYDSGIVGAHLEGPYFSQEQSGAQNPNYIKKPNPSEYEEILQTGGDLIKRWSFAPELEGGIEFCNFLEKNGIVSSIAHSNAVYEDVLAAHTAGCRLVTHFYSGMSMITRRGGYRRLGVVESAYLFDDMAVEVIADGCHLPPELLCLIVKCKGIEQVCLVTDSMRGAGMPDGKSYLGRRGEETPCIIEDGVAKMPDRSGFAGSVATADRLLRTMVLQAGISVPEAVGMLTRNPARILGLTDRGDIREGMRADIVLFDEAITINKVFSAGQSN